MSTETLVLALAALVLWQRSSRSPATNAPAGTEYGPDYPIATWDDGGTLYKRPDGSYYVRHPDGSVSEIDRMYVEGRQYRGGIRMDIAPPASAGG